MTGRFIKHIPAAFAVCLAVAVFGFGASAQEPDVSVETRLDKNRVTVGELVTYEIVITFDPELRVAAPPPGINLGGFEIRDYKDHNPVEIDGRVEKRVEFTIAAYDTGFFAIPPTGIAYMRPDSTGDVLMTDEVSIRVESILTGDAGDIRDIKGALSIQRNIMRIVLLSVLALLIITAIAGVWYYRRKKKRGEKLFEIRKEPARPAHETALEALEKLRNSSLIADGRIKEYYIGLSDILRLYFEQRYFRRFLEMTTAETLAALEELHVSGVPFTKTASALELCDLVKFAKYRPGESYHESALDDAVAIVEATKILMPERMPEPGAAATEPGDIQDDAVPAGELGPRTDLPENGGVSEIKEEN